MRTIPPTERAVVLVEHLAPETRSQSLNWIGELVKLAERYGLTLPQVRRVATDLAWRARLVEQRCPGDLEWGLARGIAGSRMMRLVLAYVHGQRLRFDYRFEELHTRCNGWLSEFHDDALVLGLAAFAGLGRRTPNGLDLFRRAVQAADADDKSRQVCLGALEFADHIAEAPEILLGLADDIMARGEDNENVHYRRAAALRKLRRYDEALVEIDRAVGLLGVGNILVHEQYAQERRTILASQDMRMQAEAIAAELGAQITARVDTRIDEASAAMEERISTASLQLGQRVSVAQELVSEGLLKMVEILGVFVTLLGFLIGSGSVIIKAKTFSERAIGMGLVLGGAVMFFLLLRLILGFRRGRRTMP